MLNKFRYIRIIHRLKAFYRRHLIFHSIFGRVIFIITLLSLFLFLSFGFIFRSVYKNHLNTVITQNGNNIGSVVEGALYRSMLMNDKQQLQNTLDLIKTMPGIDEVSLYNSKDELAYASFSYKSSVKGDAECKHCHENLREMFPLKEKAYRIINEYSACNASAKSNAKPFRQLMIRSPILNDRTCSVSSCHAHNETQEVLGSLIIKMPLKNIDTAVARSSKRFFIMAAISTVLLVLILIVFTRRKIKHPLNAIVTASEAVAAGNTDMRLEITPDLLNDMRTVSMAFNNMLDKLSNANQELKNWSDHLEDMVRKKSDELTKMQGEMIHVEKMASLGKLSSSVAHEINNPLTSVLTFTKIVHKQLEKQNHAELNLSVIKYLNIIESETKRCGDIVKGLLDFSRKDRQNFEVKHLHDILTYTHHLLDHQMRVSDIEFRMDFSAECDLVFCNDNQLKQACVAILVNACDAVSGPGAITIRTENPDENHVKFSISDTGNGISEEDMKHIFEPFFSSKEKTDSLGLGLAIVHGIVQNHKGKIIISSEIMKGTTVSVTLPLNKNQHTANDKEHYDTDC
ncbi:MAG: sensor histidine kinase [Bacteroidales bacterium]